MQEIDKLISALYLAKSDNREGMLSDLILNVLYTFSEPLNCDEIIEFIKMGFHLEPIKFEVHNRLENLIENKELKVIDNKYILSEVSKQKLYSITLKAKEESNKRLSLFIIIVNEIFDDNLLNEEIKELWDVFNDYLLECFMVFGRKAIDIFLPYKTDKISENDDIHKIAINKLSSDKLKQIFKVLVVEYPERLSDLELRYLSTLTSRAEKFYSLGIEQSEYDKIKNLKIKDLVILLDTNVLYSILNLHVHPEKAAIIELIKLSKEKLIDLRLVYLSKTYSELQQAKSWLESIISRENFKHGQVKAMLASDHLEPFARQYYEAKLLNSDTPHPTESLKYASDVLRSKGISLYNEKFNQITDNEQYLNEKIAEYYDFQRYFNNLNEERGYDLRLNKSDKKIEHDIFLREAVGILKTKFNKEDEFNFVCLTLDNSLVHFDQHVKRKENAGLHKSINPSFTFPSTLLKQIRPFIPIITHNYRKAFITSLTAPSFEYVNNADSIAVQKSMAYFKSMGIEDEEVIFNCIKKELFLKDFEIEEKKDKAEEYIKSELAKEIDLMKADISKLSEVIKQKEQDEITILTAKEEEQAELIALSENEKNEILKIKTKEVNDLNNDLSERDKFIDKLGVRMEILEQINQKTTSVLAFEAAKNKWLIEKNEYVANAWQKQLIELRKSGRYFLRVFIFTFFPILLAIIIKVAGDKFIKQIESNGISQWYLWGGLGVIQLIELFLRTYIIDKEKVKNGEKWIFNSFNKNSSDLIATKKKSIEDIFIKTHKEPQLQDFITTNETIVLEPTLKGQA
ncbi:hypothetical protein JN11_03522 [Mucilaginibacter frigoritolerans]|uniref:PIN like domain-containing protein n=1 Tax=Mucilaginibacter frigoritolerans TaxID=652788 RepID=A0A562TWJ7_9SPHI|nr:hypothetical protein [Mucilaginibacter frigoritolerans]TWI97698.1 hypothetical protein JN11_03522 [Mucilaginibacter frigoritolerans]